ncbi:hypothetical protein N0V93_010327 [Gnomoniopsis smithogilvyi]|uniref:Uncharacterized protein n=1 Tax=Gnomoniopsis smithogilvyi TaxID=1191159 RepID=A0A9W8YHY9_9PEZI|nr:hypothetical protein N0V93_010327 [Gnomoniopsis smithogilvyi]
MASSSPAAQQGPASASDAAASLASPANLANQQPELATLDTESQTALARYQAAGDIDARVLLPNGTPCGISQGWGGAGQYGLIHLHADDLVAAATTAAERSILPKAYYCVPVNFLVLKRDTIRETSDKEQYRLSPQQFLALLHASADQKPVEGMDDCECQNCDVYEGSQLGPFSRSQGIGATFHISGQYGVCANDVWVNGMD